MLMEEPPTEEPGKPLVAGMPQSLTYQGLGIPTTDRWLTSRFQFTKALHRVDTTLFWIILGTIQVATPHWTRSLPVHESMNRDHSNKIPKNALSWPVNSIIRGRLTSPLPPFLSERSFHNPYILYHLFKAVGVRCFDLSISFWKRVRRAFLTLWY